MRIVWTSEMDIGIPSIDSQHRHMADIVNSLCHELEEQVNTPSTEDVFRRFLQATSEHFAYEEKIMEETGYYDFESHQKEHQRLKEEILILEKKFKSYPNTMSSLDVFTYLRNWLLQHINESDRKFVGHFAANGIE